MSDQDIIKEAAEITFHVYTAQHSVYCDGDRETIQKGDWYYYHDRANLKSYSQNSFNPLTNANHTKMLKDKAVEMGWLISSETDDGEFHITMSKQFDKLVIIGGSGEDELRTTTEAIVEAVKKLKEPK